MSKCLTCKSSASTPFSKNDREIPLWMKKQGTYSLLPKILQTEEKYNAFKTTFKKSVPDITGIKVKVPLNLGKSKKNTWVFYWSAKAYNDFLEPGKNPTPADVYADYKNTGLIKTNAEGKVTLILSCPRPYRVEGVTYPSHVHFTTLNSDKTWYEDVYTSDVLCLLNRQQMKNVVDEKSHVIINSLDHSYYAEAHIPNSYNLSLKDLGKMNREEQSSKIDNFMRYHVKKYPKLLKLYEDKKLKIKELPIVIYCYSKTCNSAHNLVLLMLKHGYSNIIEYPGGISEWQNHYDVDTNPFSKPKSASATASASASPSANKKKRTPKKSAGTQKSIKKINKINDSIQIKHINKGSNGINSAHMFRFLQ